MNQQYDIDLGPDGRAIVDTDDVPWLEEKVRREPGSTRLRFRADDDDTEGHGMATTRVRVLVESDDDTEGHAISIHFPTAAEADAFRRRLILTGALVGTVALGAAAGIGAANLSNSDAGAGTVSAAGAGSAWTQDERAGLQAAAGSEATGSAWTQDERAGLGSPASSSTDDGEVEQLGGPQPR
jgi:hypothetical protein